MSIHGELFENVQSAARMASISAAELGIPINRVGDLKLGPVASVFMELRVKASLASANPLTAALWLEPFPSIKAIGSPNPSSA